LGDGRAERGIGFDGELRRPADAVLVSATSDGRTTVARLLDRLPYGTSRPEAIVVPEIHEIHLPEDDLLAVDLDRLMETCHARTLPRMTEKKKGPVRGWTGPEGLRRGQGWNALHRMMQGGTAPLGA